MIIQFMKSAQSTISQKSESLESQKQKPLPFVILKEFRVIYDEVVNEAERLKYL